MKCYEIHILKSTHGSLFQLESKDELNDRSRFEKVGIYRDMECLAFCILEDLTSDIGTSAKLASRYAKHLMGRACPQIIGSRDVLGWIADQVSVSA